MAVSTAIRDPAAVEHLLGYPPGLGISLSFRAEMLRHAGLTDARPFNSCTDSSPSPRRWIIIVA
jgi:hypothetical protein